MTPYSPEIENQMRCFYNSLNEKDRRRYAGMEALRYGHGGQIYIARVLGCSRNTVNKGAREISNLSKKEVEQRIGKKDRKKEKLPKKQAYRIRKKGGGRKPYHVKLDAEKLDKRFLEVLREQYFQKPLI